MVQHQSVDFHRNGFDRRREAVEAQEYAQQIEECGHGMYYTPPTFSQYPS